MLKVLSAFFSLLFILVYSDSFSQASTYFPSAPGYKWYYKNTVLDSNNNPVPGNTYRIDSFAFNATYQGLPASIVYSKNNLSNINQSGPITDSLRFNFQGQNAWGFLKIIPALDTIGFLNNVGIVNFLRSLEKWYDTYRFSSPVNTNYTIFTKDTTLQIDTLTLPLRIAMTGRRVADETITTVNGTYTCKKFVITPRLSYLLTIPPLPPIPITIMERPDTVYIAQNVWMVKEVIPSSSVNLTSFGIPVSFTIPGQRIELTDAPLNVINYSSEIPANYKLEQNYPNPFNPSTTLKFSLPKAGFVKLKIYNVAGQEMISLIDGEQEAGNYEVMFNAEKLNTGVYFYSLQAGDYRETKKMTLVK